METTIILKDILRDTINNYADAGDEVFEIAKSAIEEQLTIIIDMINVDSVPTIFMNTSFGALIDIYGVDKTKKSFKFRNILKSQVERISKYFNDYQSLLESNKV